MRHFMFGLGALALLVTGACGSSGDGDDLPDDPDAVLVVSPASVTLTVVNGVTAQQDYTVVLRSPDGSEVDVTDEVTMQMDQPSVGFFDGTTLMANGAGKGTARAILEGKQGTAIVEVFREDIRVVDGTPGNAADLFDAATDDPARVAEIVYPSTGTIVPPNLGDFDVHWRDATGSDLFEVRMTTYYADVRIYVLGVAPASGDWLAFLESEWETIARSESSARISVTVRGLTQAAPQTSSRAQIQVTTSRDDIIGGIYYWAAAAADPALPTGIIRHDMSNPGEPPEPYYTSAPDSAGRCVACHALSRDGTKMAVTYDGGNQPANVIDVATRTQQMGLDTQAWNFASFSPDGSLLLTVSAGALALRDAASGGVVANVPTGGYATHPDFSPTGERIVYVRPSSLGGDWYFGGGSLVTQTFAAAGNVFGGEVPLVTSAGENNYYPSFSPDGQWVLFNRSSEDANDDASAELWIVKTDGSVGPLRLDLANIGPGYTNSWARWAPFEGSYGEDGEPIYWLTFSSKRAFGVRLGAGRPQLWMTPFFPERAAAGIDPTAPAFRLPFQSLGTNNHIAQWTEEIVAVE